VLFEPLIPHPFRCQSALQSFNQAGRRLKIV
jgi:hypothetical protein